MAVMAMRAPEGNRLSPRERAVRTVIGVGFLGGVALSELFINFNHDFASTFIHTGVDHAISDFVFGMGGAVGGAGLTAVFSDLLPPANS